MLASSGLNTRIASRNQVVQLVLAYVVSCLKEMSKAHIFKDNGSDLPKLSMRLTVLRRSHAHMQAP